MRYNLRLYGAMKEKGLTQREFAGLVGDDPSVVSRIVNGHWNPDPMRRVKYAKALGVNPEALFDRKD